MATMNTDKRRKSERKAKRKFDTIYYNDGSGDNIPAIVGAMSRIDISKPPRFVIK